MRYDQWKTISAELSGIYRVIEEDMYYQYTTNCHTVQPKCNFRRIDAFCNCGTMPGIWINDDEDEGKKILKRSFLKTS